jgi:hypothetical protein
VVISKAVLQVTYVNDLSTHAKVLIAHANCALVASAKQRSLVPIYLSKANTLLANANSLVSNTYTLFDNANVLAAYAHTLVANVNELSVNNIDTLVIFLEQLLQ